MNNSSQIKKLVEHLSVVIKEKRLRRPAHLDENRNLGSDRQEVLDQLNGVLEPIEDIIEFYESVKDTGIEYILYEYRLLSLQQALEERQYFLSRLNSDDLFPKWVKEETIDIYSWLPILEWNGTVIAIDVDRRSRKYPCMFSTSEASNPSLVFTSIETMLRTSIAFYEKAYLVESGVVIGFDVEQRRRIRRFYNPGIYT